MDEINKGILDLGNYKVDNANEKAGAGGKSGNIQTSEVYTSRRKTPLAIWATLTGLLLALIAVAGYDYFTFKKHNIQIAQIPAAINALTGLSRRLDSAEANLRAWAADRDALFSRINKLDHKVTAKLELARKQADQMIAQAQIRMEDELNKRASAIDARLSRFESDQEADRARLAHLQQEVASVRQEIAAVRKDTGSELTNLGQKQTQDQQKLQAISNQLDRQKVEFEVTKNETRELAQGISLRVLRTDISYQRYAGWLWYLPDRKTLWIEDQGAQQPIALRPKRGGEPYELVVTRVDKNGVTGYLLVPTSDQTQPNFSAAENGEAAAPAPPAS